MRFFALGVLFLSICLVDAITAVAQSPPGDNPDVWHFGVGSLGYVQVRDELKLTEQQLAKIKEIGDEVMERFGRPVNESDKKLSRLELRQKKTAELEELQQEAIEKAKIFLTAEQRGRFWQIDIWLNGPAAFNDPDLRRDLNLTDEQRGTLKTIADEYLNGVTAIYKSLRSDVRVRPTKEELATRAEKVAEMDKQRYELRTAKDSECLAVLTDDQKARFLKLRGDKFELRRNPKPGE
jgi:Spy/CpxP family protein refolding chaperone